MFADVRLIHIAEKQRKTWGSSIYDHFKPPTISDEDGEVVYHFVCKKHVSCLTSWAVADWVSAPLFIGHNVVQSNQVPSLDSLMQDYGLTNEMDITACENANEQTVEQEFQSFEKAPLSPKETITLILGGMQSPKGI